MAFRRLVWAKAEGGHYRSSIGRAGIEVNQLDTIEYEDEEYEKQWLQSRSASPRV